MPVKISPIKILSDLGYEMVDIETDEDYLSALREGINTIEAATKGSGDKRSEALREELIRVRKERKQADPTKGIKITQKKLSPSKFFDKKEQKSPVQGKGGAIIKIGNSVTSILETLKEDQKQDKKQQGWFRKTLERFKRRKKENKLEFKVFDGLKKTATKLLAPMKNAWSEFLGFIGKVILGRILFKILEWMGNKDNQKKLQSIIKFFEDWWPTLLAAYLLFGNAFGRMAVKMGVMVARFGVRLITQIIPQLIKGLAKMKLGKLLKSIPGGGKLAPLIQGGMMIGGGMLLEKGLSGGGQDFSGEFDGIQQEFNEGGLVQHFENGAYVDDGLGYGIQGDTRTFLPGKIDPNNLSAGAGEMVVPKGASAYTGKDKKDQEAYMLKYVNEERAFQGKPPLTELTYAPGVYLSKARGPGPRTKEISDTNFDFDKMIKTTSTSKTVDGKTTIGGSISRLTEEDKQKFFAENPLARTLLNIKNQAELDNLGADISASARPQKLKQGGFVSGPGGVDKVPARLTAGEFVMSKGAVQKYGVNTLAGMNAAGGGTNIPTLMGRKPGYAGGGLVTVEPGTINSYQDAIDAGIEVEDIVTGSGRFGSIRWKEKMPKGFFGLGKQKYQVKGTKWNLSGTGGAIDKELAMSTQDYVNMKMGWTGASSAKVESKAPPKLDRITGDPGERTPPKLNRGQANITPRKTATVITPSEKKKVTVAYQEEKQKMEDKPNVEQSSKEIPEFNVMGGRSSKKIKVLGISV